MIIKWIRLGAVIIFLNHLLFSQNVEITGKLSISSLFPNEGSNTILALDSFGYLGQRSASSLGVPPTGIIMSLDSNNLNITNNGFSKVGKFEIPFQLYQQIGSFTDIDTLGAPYGKACAVWTGSEMVVWTGLPNSGAKYNPLSDIWSPINAIGEPTPRSGFSYTWTGSELIIWGGIDENQNFLSNGAKYNPSTDSWSNISNSNAPIGRTYHTAIWSESEMIIFGGVISFGPPAPQFTNTGSKYNPVTNSWASINLIDAPAPTANHTAVWADSVMIVYGGYSSDKKKYNPTSNTWHFIPGSSDLRALHTAVWTGNRMIVWGGTNNNTTGTNTGRVFNPATNTFSSTSLVNAPSPRLFHSAVWTGTEMIIWGGCSNVNGTSALNTGAKYNPATNIWSPMTNNNAPSARFSHAGVWTGDKKIIWGGMPDSSTILKTGSVFDTSGGIYNSSSNIDIFLFQKN